MKPNYDALLVAGQDYRDARYRLSSAFPHGVSIYNETRWGDRKVQLADVYFKTEAVIYALSDFSGIPWTVMVAASRIEERYYERGGTKCLDSERLIHSLMPA